MPVCGSSRERRARRARSAAWGSRVSHTGWSSLAMPARLRRARSLSVIATAVSAGSAMRLSSRARSCRCACGRSSTATAAALTMMAPSSDGRGSRACSPACSTGTNSVLAIACVPPGTWMVRPGGVVVRSARRPSPSGASTSMTAPCSAVAVSDAVGGRASELEPAALDAGDEPADRSGEDTSVDDDVDVSGDPQWRGCVLGGVQHHHLPADEGPFGLVAVGQLDERRPYSAAASKGGQRYWRAVDHRA